MAAGLLSTNKLKIIKISAIIFSLLLIIFIIYFPNYAKLRKLRQGNLRLSEENKKLEQEIADYEENIQKISQDRYIYEKIARDSLGIAKDDEIVIDIE